ncbi:2-hydroxyacyl-CoA dehydratase subunit D [Thermodesulfobacteriota bacterium]
MEERLHDLIESNSEANRTKWAMEWKKHGKKVIGVMSSYVPEEVISAAGMLPWRITGTWNENISHTRVYRGESSCGYCNHVLESFLIDELDFLDGIVVTDQDQDTLRLWDLLVYLKTLPFCHAIHIPFADSDLTRQFYTNEIRRLTRSLEDYGGTEVSEGSLISVIETYNRTRSLLNRVYELRKRDIPPISGSEALGIMTAVQIMPKEKFNHELETLLPYLEKREVNLKQGHPRLMIISDKLDNPAYLDLVEEACLIAMDDMDTGTRYFIQNVDTTLEDPVYALAKRYISRHGAPRMNDWAGQLDQIIKWVNEYKIDGVLGLPQMWDYAQWFRMPFSKNKLQAAGIPVIFLEREYHLANVGQLRTRIGAFVEMLT